MALSDWNTAEPTIKDGFDTLTRMYGRPNANNCLSWNISFKNMHFVLQISFAYNSENKKIWACHSIDKIIDGELKSENLYLTHLEIDSADVNSIYRAFFEFVGEIPLSLKTFNDVVGFYKGL